LILLLLFGTGCRTAELVDAKKKRRDDDSSDDDREAADDKDILIAETTDGDAPEGVDATSGLKRTVDTVTRSAMRMCDCWLYGVW
jgi:hypothetical protein